MRRVVLDAYARAAKEPDGAAYNTRADIEFTAEVCAIAVAEGANVVNIPDTVGYTTPAEYAEYFRRLYELVPELAGVEVSVHGHDDLGLAVSNSYAGLLAGAIQRQQADQRHELMIRELRHRSGNLFAQLLALFSQTSRTARSVPDLVTKYQARVLALANAHRLITEGGWQSTSLKDLLRVLLAPRSAWIGRPRS